MSINFYCSSMYICWMSSCSSLSILSYINFSHSIICLSRSISRSRWIRCFSSSRFKYSSRRFSTSIQRFSRSSCSFCFSSFSWKILAWILYDSSSCSCFYRSNSASICNYCACCLSWSNCCYRVCSNWNWEWSFSCCWSFHSLFSRLSSWESSLFEFSSSVFSNYSWLNSGLYCSSSDSSSG